jgi:hypothetical protein
LLFIEVIPTFKTSDRVLQHSKHQRGYSNIQNTREVIPTFTTPEGLFQYSEHQRTASVA